MVDYSTQVSYSNGFPDKWMSTLISKTNFNKSLDYQRSVSDASRLDLRLDFCRSIGFGLRSSPISERGAGSLPESSAGNHA